jgi:hypothetical protein
LYASARPWVVALVQETEALVVSLDLSQLPAGCSSACQTSKSMPDEISST